MNSLTPQTERFVFGTVPYMNAAPLVHFLPQVSPGSILAAHPPRELSNLLLTNTLDAALMPVVDVLSNPKLAMLPNLGVAAFGPVRSVLIVSKTDLPAIRTIRLDPESSTSNALAQLVMKRHFHKTVRFLEATEPWQGETDAEVIIGDRALLEANSGIWQCDLSEAWHVMTGLPFVFAAWAVRTDSSAKDRLVQLVEQAYQMGHGAISGLARTHAQRLSLPEAACLDYLSNVIHYRLTSADHQAIAAFSNMLATDALGVLQPAHTGLTS